MIGATIVFADIVRYSRKPTAIQKQLVESLTSVVNGEIDGLTRPPEHLPELIPIPTGDGLALAFIHTEKSNWDFHTIVRLIIRMQMWAVEQTREGYSDISLRVGVHDGIVEYITDINGNVNICGDAINYAQRVMNAADPNQVLFSDETFRGHVGDKNPQRLSTVLSDDTDIEFTKDSIEVFAKHDQRIPVHIMTVSPKDIVGLSNSIPISSYYQVVSLTELPKEMVGTFADQLKASNKIAFIQLTGESFLHNYKVGNIELGKQLQRFWVFMPDPDSLASSSLQAPRPEKEKLSRFVSEWKEFFRHLAKEQHWADLKLGLFKDPPFLGASFLDWDKPEGRIHVSPYIWNLQAIDCPRFELQWIGRVQSAVYEAYVRGLDYLNSHTDNVAFS